MRPRSMTYSALRSRGTGKHPRGIVLVLTLIVLVVLTVIVYTLTTRVRNYRRYQQYMIDYQQARYACESAVKYALAEAGSIELKYINREGYVDFSDVFAMDQEQFERFLADWADRIADQIEEGEPVDTEWIFKEDPFAVEKSKDPFAMMFNNLMFESSLESDDPNETNEFSDEQGVGGEFGSEDDDFQLSGGLFGQSGEPREGQEYEDPNEVLEEMTIDPNNLKVPGPYGPPWPLVMEPYEFDIEDASIRIEIMDENAKMPLTWAIIQDEEIEREAQAAVQTFCEWMQMESSEIRDLVEQLQEVRKIKEYQVDPKDVTLVEKKGIRSAEEDEKEGNNVRRTMQRLSRDRKNQAVKENQAQQKETRPAIYHQTDFARLLHSTVINREKLDDPIEGTGARLESARKYLALWGSQRVNINSAPRHVLEAAFMFAGQPVEISQAIIEERKAKHFASMKDLKDRLYQYSNYFDRAEDFISTESRYLAIRVSARKGSATVSAVATVIKDGDKVQPISVMYY